MKCKKMNRLISIFVATALLLSIIGVFYTPVEAGELAPDPEDDFVEIVNIVGDLDCYVGEQNIAFELQVESLLYGDGTESNVTDVWVEVDPGNNLGEITWVNNIHIPGENGTDMSEPDGDQFYSFGPFEFHANPDATPGEYVMDIEVHYVYVDDENVTQDGTLETWLTFEIWENTNVLDIDTTLWAGEHFQELEVDVENIGDEAVQDIYLELSGAPAGVSILDSTAYIPGDLPDGETTTAYFRVDVAANVDPGIYTLDYELVGTRDGVEITEVGVVDVVVEFTPRIEADIEDQVTIEQGDTEVTFEVDFENTGNVDLSDVHIGLITDDDFFVQTVDHYEYGEDVRYVAVPLGDLSVGDTETMEITIGLHRYLQDGLHKMMFRWDGWYYNDGSTGEATRYIHVGADWDQTVSPNRAILYEVEEDDHMYNPGAGDTELESPWRGPYGFLQVSSVAIHMTATSEQVALLGDITYVQLEVTLTNHELVDFKDLIVELEVGENTPFLNPVDPSLDHVEMDPISGDYLAAEDSVDVYFNVDINSAYVQQRLNEGAHAYVSYINVTRAVNVDTNEELSGFQIPVTGELRGMGPRLVVEGELEDNLIEPGEIFTLNYTISNHGDDTARDTWVSMIPELYDNENWDVLHGFIKAISSSTDVEDFGLIHESKNVSEEVTLESLGIDSAEDLVDLHFYFEGALSAPRPHIWTLYVGELAPGESVTVSFSMVSSQHMQLGEPYQETISIQTMDSDGEMWEVDYPITIRTQETEEEEETTGIFGMESPLFEVLLIAIIVIIALIVAMIAMARKSEKPAKEEEVPEIPEESPEDQRSWAETPPLDDEEVSIEEDSESDDEEVW